MSKLSDKGDTKATVQRYKELKNEAKISSNDLFKSSKHLLFLSFQTHQKRHVGTIFQIARLIGLPDVHQQANKSMTLLNIT